MALKLMISIGRTDFYIATPSLPRSKFEEYSTSLFDDWETYVDNVLKLPDYSLSLTVEEGSVKAVAKIAATTIGVLYLGIGQYGSFISGVETIKGQIESANTFFGERASAPFNSSKTKPVIRKHGESLTQLRNLFIKVQRGTLTIEEAISKSERIFGPEVEENSEFMADLRKSLEEVPLFPKQMNLSLDSTETKFSVPDIALPKGIDNKSPKKPKPMPEHFRVEVWRDTKKSKKNSRFLKL